MRSCSAKPASRSASTSNGVPEREVMMNIEVVASWGLVSMSTSSGRKPAAASSQGLCSAAVCVIVDVHARARRAAACAQVSRSARPGGSVGLTCESWMGGTSTSGPCRLRPTRLGVHGVSIGARTTSTRRAMVSLAWMASRVC